MECIILAFKEFAAVSCCTWLYIVGKDLQESLLLVALSGGSVFLCQM